MRAGTISVMLAVAVLALPTSAAEPNQHSPINPFKNWKSLEKNAPK